MLAVGWALLVFLGWTVPFWVALTDAKVGLVLPYLLWAVAALVAAGTYFWELHRFFERNRASIELSLSGRLHEACEGFEANARSTSSRVSRAKSIFNLALAKLELGELDEAASLFGEIERRKLLGPTGLLWHHSAGYLSLCMALEGDLKNAGDWLGVALQRAAKPWLRSCAPMLAEAALLCRQGKLAEMDALAKEKGPPPTALSDIARLFRVFHAFALDGLGDAGLPGVLAKAAPATEREYTFLGVRWPEMAAFLERHRL